MPVEREQDVLPGGEVAAHRGDVHAGVRGTVAEIRTGNGEFADTDAVLLVVDPASGMSGLGEGAQ